MRPDEYLDGAFQRTPEAFHDAVRQTLRTLEREERPVKRKMKWAPLLALMLALLATAAVAAYAGRIGGALEWLTDTAAVNRIVPQAREILKQDVARTEVNDCVIELREVVYDGERLAAVYAVRDPRIAQLGREQDEEGFSPFDLYALENLRTPDVSEGTLYRIAQDFAPGEGADEVVYSFEARVKGQGEAFELILPVGCTWGPLEQRLSLTAADAGTHVDFDLPEEARFEGYAARLTKLRAAALGTYAEVELRFDADTAPARRQEIVDAWLEGTILPEGLADVVPGDADEIAHPTGAQTHADGRVAVSFEGSAREEYPGAMLAAPRYGTEAFYEGEEEKLPAPDFHEALRAAGGMGR